MCAMHASPKLLLLMEINTMIELSSDLEAALDGLLKELPPEHRAMLQKAARSLHTLRRAYALCWALGQLVELDKRAEARKALRSFFRAIAMVDPEEKKPVSPELKSVFTLTLGVFFDFDGDMDKGSKEIGKALQERCPGPLWPVFYETLQEEGKSLLKALLETFKKEKGKGSTASQSPGQETGG